MASSQGKLTVEKEGGGCGIERAASTNRKKKVIPQDFRGRSHNKKATIRLGKKEKVLEEGRV